MTMTERTCLNCGAPKSSRNGKYCSIACRSQFLRDEKMLNWKGDDVSYTGLHQWVSRLKGRPTRCEFCGKTEGRLEWANVSGEYRREADDWMPLCVKCHRRYDWSRKPTCVKGHPWTPESTRIRTHGWRTCRICSTDRRRERRALGKAG